MTALESHRTGSLLYGRMDPSNKNRKTLVWLKKKTGLQTVILAKDVLLVLNMQGSQTLQKALFFFATFEQEMCHL